MVFIYKYKRILHLNWIMHLTQLLIFSCWRGYIPKASIIIPKRNQVLHNSHECNNNNVLTIYLVYADLTQISPLVSIIVTHRDVPCTQVIAKKQKKLLVGNCRYASSCGRYPINMCYSLSNNFHPPPPHPSSSPSPPPEDVVGLSPCIRR
jgi:hypothetical protein